MFCYQCEEALNGQGCTKTGVCGKSDSLANLQDKLIFALKGLSYYASRGAGTDEEIDNFVLESLFSTLTNTNFDPTDMERRIWQALKYRDAIKGSSESASVPDAARMGKSELMGSDIGVLSTVDVNIRSLRELLTYGVKGLAAYTHHANILGYQDKRINKFVYDALAATLGDLTINDLVALAMECGKNGVDAMALLDKANTETFGDPTPTKVNTGVGKRPGILISGHDLKDLHDLLEQTKGTGIDVYTHGEMLPAHSYPKLRAFENLVGNYGGAWWKQREEFESFNGPIVMTTNCIVKPKETYSGRIYTTGAAGYDGIPHLPVKGGVRDFSQVIEQAKASAPPTQLEEGYIWSGFAHKSVLSVADKIIGALGSKKIRKFIVMAGCDGRHKEREYYTEFAKELPHDSIILTAGCAKYRYNKLDLGDIDGIPRVLDAGQCNDSYSLVVTALKLRDALGMEDINDLPIAYNIAWYEQKAVLVLLSLLHLGVKDITLGPKLPAFLSEDVLKVLVDTFGIRQIGNVDEDMDLLVN